MHLYLVRHGKAEPGIDDAARRLTDGGHKAVRRMARRLDEAGVRVERIEHSGLARAEQTDGILAEEVGGTIAVVSDLAPEGDVEPVAERAGSARVDSLMLVGHNPFMERMAASLLTGDPEAGFFHFRTGAIACFSRESHVWMLEWFLYPDLA